MNYYLTELHAHTHHSDGDFQTLELIEHAKTFGYDVLAITDHNTMAPLKEVPLDESDELLILPGMEWTTFFGHLLVIGTKEVIDWRTASLETIDDSLKAVQAADGITGIAHPFSIGSPICTGCHWDFHVQDYHLVDFIEVWNRLNPDEDFRSQQAYEMWLDLLDQGYKLACSAGRDWHRVEEENDSTALTYVGAKEKSTSAILSALKKGCFYISLGPRLEIKLEQAGRHFVMGEELKEGNAQLTVCIQPTEQEKMKQFGFKGNQLVVWQNREIVACETIVEGEPLTCEFNLRAGYFRVEVFGSGKGQQNKRLLISNPFYVKAT